MVQDTDLNNKKIRLIRYVTSINLYFIFPSAPPKKVDFDVRRLDEDTCEVRCAVEAVAPEPNIVVTWNGGGGGGGGDSAVVVVTNNTRDPNLFDAELVFNLSHGDIVHGANDDSDSNDNVSDDGGGGGGARHGARPLLTNNNGRIEFVCKVTLGEEVEENVEEEKAEEVEGKLRVARTSVYYLKSTSKEGEGGGRTQGKRCP